MPVPSFTHVKVFTEYVPENVYEVREMQQQTEPLKELVFQEGLLWQKISDKFHFYESNISLGSDAKTFLRS